MRDWYWSGWFSELYVQWITHWAVENTTPRPLTPGRTGISWGRGLLWHPYLYNIQCFVSSWLYANWDRFGGTKTISPCVWSLLYIRMHAHVSTHTFQASEKPMQVLSQPSIRLTHQLCCFLLISSFLPTFPIHSSLRSESWETDPCELPFSASCQPALGLARGWRAGGKRAQDHPPLLSPSAHHSGNNRPSKNVATGLRPPPLLLLPIKPGEPGFFPNDAHLGVSSHLWWSPWGGPQLCERSLHWCVWSGAAAWTAASRRGSDAYTRGQGCLFSPRGPAWLVGSKEEDRASLFYLRSPSVMICETRSSPAFTEGPPPHIFVVVVQGTWLGFIVQLYSCSWLHINL